ncbi:mechanosensitive ion channel family protein [Sinobaca sp. H24]|uniref:mechanosensitive ion channel family protein n=1 Tax=Sinobaca sp. H24 TaxID=2923376 RepID=UPI00207AE3E9|nr:mechanosensitive ion channel family protein [Sinobaca sp. H24]
MIDFWMRTQEFFINLPWIDIGFAILIFFLIFFLRRYLTTYIFRLLIRVAKKTPTDVFTNVIIAFEKPLRFFFVILGLYLALLSLPIQGEYMGIVNRFYRTAIIIVVGWGLFNFTAASSSMFYKLSSKMDDGEDSMLLPFLSRIVRFVILALTLTIIAHEWNYDINGLIAGLGLGGLAFALAAQETLSNFLGGIIIVTERPFKKGDWIASATVEGFVEDINFRSTKIRTFEDSLVIVPNKTLAHEAITNWSEMGKRQITFNVGVKYGTPREDVQRVVARIEETLQENDKIDNELIIVRFSEFNSFSLDIFVYFFTKATGWVDWFEAKEDINFEVMQILEEEGVEIAFPSESVYIENASAEAWPDSIKQEIAEKTKRAEQHSNR